MIKKISLGGDHIGWPQMVASFWVTEYMMDTGIKKVAGLREIIVSVNRGCYGHSKTGQLESIHEEPV